MGTHHAGMRLDRGDGFDLWGHALGAHDTGWIRAMGVIYGEGQLWLDREDVIGLREHAALAELGRWD